MFAARGISSRGRKVLLGLMAGSKKDRKTVFAFFQDMNSRNLSEPLLVVSDGAAGIIKAIETCFPRSERQRCLAHRMRNLACKVMEDRWPEFKVRAQAACQAPSRAIARDLAGKLETASGRSLLSAVACFLDDFEACIFHLRMPVDHRRSIRTANVLERLFVEERRRMKIIPNAWGKRAVLKLMFGAMIRASERWRSMRVTHFETLQMEALRKVLGEEYRERTGPEPEAQAGAHPSKFSSRKRA